MPNESLSNEINNIGVLLHEEMILQKCFLKLSFFLILNSMHVIHPLDRDFISF